VTSLTFTVTGIGQSQSGVVIVEPLISSVSLGNITINTPQGAAVNLLVQPSGANTFSSLGSVTNNGLGELWIGLLRINGSISGSVIAQSINELDSDGDILGEIRSTGSLPNGQGQPGRLVLVRSRDGSILADIIAKENIEVIDAAQ